MITVIYLSFSELFWRKLFVGNKAKEHFCNSQNTKSLTNGLSGIHKGVIQIVRHSQNDSFWLIFSCQILCALTFTHTRILTSHVSKVGELQFFGCDSIAISEAQIILWIFLFLFAVIFSDSHEIQKSKIWIRR